jgi:hypothetical protein
MSNFCILVKAGGESYRVEVRDGKLLDRTAEIARARSLRSVMLFLVKLPSASPGSAPTPCDPPPELAQAGDFEGALTDDFREHSDMGDGDYFNTW